MFRKNDECVVTISDLGNAGEGIGRIDGYVLFVKDTVIGDTVRVKVMKAKKNYGYAKLLEIVEASKNRIEAPCPQARRCGGCQLQFMNYKEQLRFKTEKVKNNIRHIGGIDVFEMEKIMGMEEPFYYRNKAQFPVGMDRDGNIVSGFYAGRTHAIIPIEHCMLGLCPEGNDVNAEVMKIVRDFMKQMRILPYDEKTGKGLVRHVLIRIGKATGQVMVCLVINGHKLPHAEILVDALREVPNMTDISLRKSARICKSYGDGNGMGFVLRDWKHFSVSCTESRESVWRGNCTGGGARRAGKCKNQSDSECGIFYGRSRGACAGVFSCASGSAGMQP